MKLTKERCMQAIENSRIYTDEYENAELQHAENLETFEEEYQKYENQEDIEIMEQLVKEYFALKPFILQYENLRRYFRYMAVEILGPDYHNEGTDVYLRDKLTCKDILSCFNRGRAERFSDVLLGNITELRKQTEKVSSQLKRIEDNTGGIVLERLMDKTTVALEDLEFIKVEDSEDTAIYQNDSLFVEFDKKRHKVLISDCEKNVHAASYGLMMAICLKMQEMGFDE